MVEATRKRSPRAPSMDLPEALERTGKAYDKERLHPAPTEVVAQNIGYRDANNGSAMAALASLRYYGLVERPREGVLAVSKDYENYRFAPEPAAKRALIEKFFRTPPLFRELLDQYENGFPSEATLRYELMQRGFLPQAAATLVTVLMRSIEFLNVQHPLAPETGAPSLDAALNDAVAPETPALLSTADAADRAHDRIPVRLSGNRRAWLVIPEPFFEADKKRLKAQIDLLLTEDDDAENRR